MILKIKFNNEKTLSTVTSVPGIGSTVRANWKRWRPFNLTFSQNSKILLLKVNRP